MNRTLKKTLIWTSIVLFFTTGFRVFPGGNNWAISNASATASKIFVHVNFDLNQSVTNDFPASDALASDTTLTTGEVLGGIYTDYNNVAGAFVTLAPESDGDFAANSAGRTINIETGAPGGAADGAATQTWTGSSVTGCTIQIKESLLSSGVHMTTILTHEIGHCLGLDHAQDTVNAIMSYFVADDVFRLQIDDKMGLIYLYPTDADKAKEDSTLGLSCARR